MSKIEDKKEPPQKIHFGVTQEVNEDQRKMLMELVDIMGVKELSARVDRQEQLTEALTIKTSEVVNSLNTLITTLQNEKPATTTFQQATQQGNQMDKIQALGQLVQSLEPIISKYFSPQPVQQTILDPEIINQHLRDSMLGNFEIGKALTDTLKSKVTQRALGKVVSDIVHEPA